MFLTLDDSSEMECKSCIEMNASNGPPDSSSFHPRNAREGRKIPACCNGYHMTRTVSAKCYGMKELHRKRAPIKEMRQCHETTPPTGAGSEVDTSAVALFLSEHSKHRKKGHSCVSTP